MYFYAAKIGTARLRVLAFIRRGVRAQAGCCPPSAVLKRNVRIAVARRQSSQSCGELCAICQTVKADSRSRPLFSAVSRVSVRPADQSMGCLAASMGCCGWCMGLISPSMGCLGWTFCPVFCHIVTKNASAALRSDLVRAVDAS